MGKKAETRKITGSAKRRIRRRMAVAVRKYTEREKIRQELPRRFILMADLDTVSRIAVSKPLSETFSDLFVSRSDDFAEQYLEKLSGEAKYSRMDRPLVLNDIEAHLDGSKTIGLYAINPKDQTVKWICWDIDLERDLGSGEGHELARETAKSAVVKLLAAIKARGFNEKAVMVEYSGQKGYHLWLFFKPPILAVAAYFIGREIAESAGLGKSIEVFPKQKQLLSPYGNLVKLPCGIHKRTNNRCNFLDESWNPLAPESIKTVLTQTLVVDEYMKHQIAYEAKPWLDAVSSTTEAAPYVGEHMPCIRTYLAGVESGERDQVAVRLAAYLLNFRGMRNNEQGRSSAWAQLQEWNDKNSPPLPNPELSTIFQQVARNPGYNYGCHDELLSRTCQVGICPLMKEKAPVLFGEFTEATLTKAEQLLGSPDLLRRFIEATNRWIIRDEHIRRNILRTCVSAFCENPINQALFGRDSIGKSHNAVHVARLLDNRSKHVWFLGGLSPTSFIYDYGEYDNTRKCSIAKLSGVTMLFLEPPHPETLAKLKPILSHDKEEVMFKVTQKTKGGQLRTLKCIVQGWPAVIECAAQAGYAGGEFSSRFMTGTPEVSKEKTKDGIMKIGDRFQDPEGYGFDSEEVGVWAAAYEILSKEAPIKVRIPYAKALAENFSVRGPETMRVFSIFVRLIAANTALHCKQRHRDEKGYYMANLDDFEQVLPDFEKIAAPTFLGLSGDTLQLFRELAGRTDLDFEQIDDLARQTFGADTSETTMRTVYIRRLVAAGLLKEKQNPADKRRTLYDAVEARSEIKAFTDLDALRKATQSK
jgi:hypothetical protein